MKSLGTQTGIALLELIISIVVIAVLTVTAVPAFRSMVDNQRVRGATQGLFADMQYAKSEAIKRGADVSVITTAGSSWSYCVTTTTCAAPLKSVSGTEFSNTSLDVGATVTFNSRRGSANQQTLTFTGTTGITDSVTVSALGRISIP